MKTVELEGCDFALIIKMAPMVDAVGNVTNYVPRTFVYVGDKQIGLVSNVTVKASTSGLTPDIEVELVGGMSYENVKAMPDSLKETLKDYARLLGTVPGVKVKSPL